MIGVGKRREAISGVRRSSSKDGSDFASGSEALTPIVFKGATAYVVAGQESGQVYCFTVQDPEQMIDARDAEALLSTGLFRMR